MKTVRIMTAWTGSGTKDDPYRPAVAAEHSLRTWTDVSHADPALNQPYQIEASCEDAELNALQNDPKYQGKIVDITNGS